MSRLGAGRTGRRLGSGMGVAVMVVSTLIASCSPSAEPEEALPPAPPVVVVTMTEYHFGYEQPIPPGRVVFRFVNAGKEEHRPSMLPLPEDVPSIAEQLRGSERRVSAPFASIRTREPGQTGTFAVDLEPGQRYALICFVMAADGQSHALKGMNSEFRAE